MAMPLKILPTRYDWQMPYQ